MNLSPRTNTWGLIRLRMVLEMIPAATHRCIATTGATIDVLGVYLRGSNSKFLILGVEANIQQRKSSMCVVNPRVTKLRFPTTTHVVDPAVGHQLLIVVQQDLALEAHPSTPVES